jgi:2-polyprenyl-3-methyl-5-hydroxy-6-metoxy-1,4-benzoquinol methylase
MNRLMLKAIDKIGITLSGYSLKQLSQNTTKNTYRNERPIEYGFALKHLSESDALEVLDVGTGTNSFSSTLKHCGFNVTSSDLMGGYWRTYQNRHTYVVQDDITNTKLRPKSFDAVMCLSVLEHIPNFQEAVRGISKLVKPGGFIILTFPYTHDKFCENVYALEESDPLSKTFRYICHSFSENEIAQWCADHDLEVVDRKYIQGWTGKFWRTGERIAFPKVINTKEEANCACFKFLVK